MGVVVKASGTADTTEVPAVITDLIPRAEMAKQLNVCPHTLRGWERCGQGPPAIRLGKRVYYRAETVRRWLLDREGTTTTA
jgi:predicted site-specific integrase-resolvase